MQNENDEMKINAPRRMLEDAAATAAPLCRRRPCLAMTEFSGVTIHPSVSVRLLRLHPSPSAGLQSAAPAVTFAAAVLTQQTPPSDGLSPSPRCSPIDSNDKTFGRHRVVHQDDKDGK